MIYDLYMGNNHSYSSISQDDNENGTRDVKYIPYEFKYTELGRIREIMKYVQLIDAPSFIGYKLSREINSAYVISNMTNVIPEITKNKSKGFYNTPLLKVESVTNGKITMTRSDRDVCIGLFSSEMKIDDMFTIHITDEKQPNKTLHFRTKITTENRFHFIIENELPLVNCSIPFVKIQINVPKHWRNVYTYNLVCQHSLRLSFGRNVLNMYTRYKPIAQRAGILITDWNIVYVNINESYYPVLPRSPERIIFDAVIRYHRKRRLNTHCDDEQCDERDIMMMSLRKRRLHSSRDASS